LRTSFLAGLLRSATVTVPTEPTTYTLLAFLTTSCASCRPGWETLAASPPDRQLGVQVVVVTPSRSMEDEPLARSLLPPGAGLHMGSETWFSYGIGKAGTFVLVRTRSGDAPPWERPGEVLGSASLESPSEVANLAELVKGWLERPAPA